VIDPHTLALCEEVSMANTLVAPARGSRGYLALISFIAALGGFLFGFDTAVVSGALVHLKVQYALTSLMEGFLVASALVGCMGGALMAGALSDRFGRKAMLIVSAVLFVVGAVGTAVPPSVALLITARLIGGVGVGVASMLAPMYLSEVSPPEVRGRLISLYQLAITIGIVVAYFSNVYLQWLSTHTFAGLGEGFWRWMLVDEVWRGMFAAGVIPAVVFLLLLLMVPETPRWLAKQGRLDESRVVLARVVGGPQADAELKEIQQTLAQEGGSLWQLLQPGLRIALVIGILLPFFSQVSGINAIVYYGTTIFHEAGWELSESLGGQAYVGFVNVIFTLVAVAVVDRLGRKPLLYVGVTGLVIALLAASALFAAHLTNWQLVAVLMLYTACFAFSLGPVPWIIIAEIFPTRIRGRAMSVGTFTIWLTNTIVMLVFPTLRDGLGPSRTFLLFALLVFPALLLTWLLIPETKGRSLEEIERSWQHRA
jgi:MFS transporter, SP family, arabinose:H+ symporter